ncbi:MAG: sulfur carrier protein ThiS [Pseudomonadota bacterium]
MNVLINDTPYTLAEGATLADAIAALAAVPPYAAAVNRAFVPRSIHAAHVLKPDDRIEVIRPVTGG